jgi:hypothetical protein
VVVLVLLFTGCSVKREIQKSQSYMVVIKMKNITFNDTGFLKYGKNFTELQLFDLANLVMDLKIDDDICLNSHCFGKEEFNRRFLSSLYPKDLLAKVLHRKPIFEKTGYKKTKNGFLQVIKRKNLYIKYIISSDKLYFKDFSNHILIKLKRI